MMTQPPQPIGVPGNARRKARLTLTVPHAVSRTVLHVLVTAVMAGLAGCSAMPHRHPATRNPASAPGTSPTPGAGCGQDGRSTRPPDPYSLDADDPTTVSCAVLTLLWTTDTTIDPPQQGQHTASLRAAATTYVTPRLAARLRAEPAIPAPGRIWATWAAHHAYNRVQLSRAHDDGAPPDTASRALRQWKIMIVPTGRDGWTGPAITTTAFVTVIRDTTQACWQVDDVRYG